MAASGRRVGAETSKTRDALLDCVETMMLEDGYASVTYRALATKAGVTPSLVQYYFPVLDDIFIAAISRYSQRNIEYLNKILAKRTEDPLRALWEYNWDEATGALMTEFMALGNHRKTIQAEIASVTEHARKIQLDALTAKFGKDARPFGNLSLPALQLLISSLPKFLNLEKGIGVQTAHAELTKVLEDYLDTVEPRPTRTKRAASGKRRTPKSGS
ncbi:TetR family transcriptional regulator [Mycolicibacterium conceptionense]|uniref:TetR family transcriptional regulator n=1 Tax=Mycolicibacterium conceptionense TaxID=451644 RepID=A0A1A0PA56_9MYCO|nr:MULTISPECIES: TetR/AcrR family transcriptional regulator [Mycolicibacterium]MCW1822597.1 TetR/AcrR family transcriptional regulator [Mycolicibacterium senegalense]OBB06850.1 TetR family transcriptional regulator [Mycolicibacterium conceptionense]OBE96139.1 TetR family transcriptional regulator [Mycolicibacterium conceptionense]OBF27604.1 TetR family transcriptional regulator [Mycolicibacterium conceptionense]OBF45416.1 TetR family transcriptional regulator [Mycolicibacterium conceptionense]